MGMIYSIVQVAWVRFSLVSGRDNYYYTLKTRNPKHIMNQALKKEI